MSKCPLTGLPCLHNKCIHITEVANYQATETKDMCILCGVDYMAAEGGPAFNPEVQQVFQMINNAVKNPHMQEENIVIVQEWIPQAGCLTCGHTLEDILTIGKIGCGDCYEFYKKELMPLIEKCQAGGLHHVGKKPKSIQPKLPDLERKLQEAVNDENYALCAKLRDEIKNLKGGQ